MENDEAVGEIANSGGSYNVTAATISRLAPWQTPHQRLLTSGGDRILPGYIRPVIVHLSALHCHPALLGA